MWRGRSPFDPDLCRSTAPRALARAQSAGGAAAQVTTPVFRPTPTAAARTPRKTIVRLVSPGPNIQFTSRARLADIDRNFPGASPALGGSSEGPSGVQ